MALRRARRKADGTVELPETLCPRCRTKNLGTTTDGRWYCWRCGKGGHTQGVVNIPHSVDAPSGPTEPRSLSELPVFARAMMERRGADPAWCESRYRVRWNGERLAWPCGAGLSMRAIWSWQSPKTLTVAPRGLIGQHLLTPGAHVVVTEGDFKAASIPLPWVGVGIMGTAMTQDQALVLLNSRPGSITVLLDGGCGAQAQAIRISLAPTPVRVVDSLPVGAGPDDIDRGELTRMLMEEVR